MRRICAWCKKELTPREDMGTEREITHGICSRCTQQFSSATPATSDIEAMLAVISEPVLMVDSHCMVQSANESGLELLGKDLDSIREQLGGDVLECVYAKQPEGCGRTEHCETCTIRNVLMDTLTHGRSYKNVPAYQKILTPNGERIMCFYISTEKVGEQILLRIDDVADNIYA